MKVPSLKLHGSINEPEALIATIDSTAPRLHPSIMSVLNLVVSPVPEPVPWIWIGCSMRDRDVNDWLRSRNAKELDESWVNPFPGSSLDEFIRDLREPAWRNSQQTLQERLIIDSADRFLDQLAQETL